MLSAASLAVVYWLLKCAAAAVALVGAAIYAVVHTLVALKDRKRMKAAPPQTCHAAFNARDAMAHLGTRPSPCFASMPKEKVAHLAEVAQFIRPGDPLGFAGKSFFGIAVRIVKYCLFSHVLMVAEPEGDKEATVIDCCEGVGVSERSLAAEVTKYPGQIYWGVIHPAFDEHYHRDHAVTWARSQIGQPYGYAAIAFQVALSTPGLRELAFALQLHRLFRSARRFCSGFLNTATAIGAYYMVRRRDPALVAPSDIYQSSAVIEWIALVP